MKDLFPENEDSSPEFEGVGGNIPIEVLLSIAPPQVIEALSENVGDQILNATGKLGKIAAITGHGSFRAGVGKTSAGDEVGAISAFMLVSINAAALQAKGVSVDEFSNALTNSVKAVQAYFDSFKDEE